MKRLIPILVLIACLTGVAQAADDFTYFQIVMPDTKLAEQKVQTNLPPVLCTIWRKAKTPENLAWVMQGWNSNSWMFAANTNLVVCEYLITVEQSMGDLKSTLIESEMARIMQKIKNDPQIRMAINSDPKGNMEAWGFVPRPSTGPE